VIRPLNSEIPCEGEWPTCREQQAPNPPCIVITASHVMAILRQMLSNGWISLGLKPLDSIIGGDLTWAHTLVYDAKTFPLDSTTHHSGRVRAYFLE
jgi:hypothetical protein